MKKSLEPDPQAVEAYRNYYQKYHEAQIQQQQQAMMQNNTMEARYNALMKQEELQRNEEKQHHEALQEQYQYLRDEAPRRADPMNTD